MGCSHSFHILMSINMRMGMTLRSSTLLAPGDRTFRASSGNEKDKEPESHTGTFTLPVKRARLLERALLELAHARWVDVDVLRAVLGVWSFGAQLRRDLYRMIELCEGQFVRQRPSVRDELSCMPRAVTFMEYEGRLQFSDVFVRN